MTPQILLITGTDTDVGKTIATAAIAAVLDGRGLRVAVDKPTQTGVDETAPGDADEVRRLAGSRVATTTGIRLVAAMAPVPAARREHRTLPTLADHVDRIAELTQRHDVVLVEGAGGVLVELTAEGETIADLGRALGARVLVVTRAGLGTLNHTQLTLEALAAREVPASGIVIGSWPDEPDFVEVSNLEHLEGLPAPVIGRIPAGAAAFAPARFRAEASGWLPRLTV